uniref:Uncharacterized protein MANES_05G095300 n=1 Tax=Rhizophora mucronata TaxID=61149 RepID=A0A2P2IJV7_RHIMU
MASRQEPS